MKTSLALVPLLGLAACAGGGSSTGAQSEPTSYGGNGGQTQQRFPGATGLLAAIDGGTLQVQSETEQTAVTYTAKTTFTDTVAATAAAVTVGSCVLVRDSSAPPTTASTGPSSLPTVAPTQATTVTATSVQVSAPVSGTCTGGAGQLRGPLGTPPPGAAPPLGGPSGGPGGARFAGGPGGAVGKVVSKTATGFVVASTRPGETSTTEVTVTTTTATTYTSESRVTASALKVGKCVTARGTTDSSGTVAATSIAVRPATNGTCTTGFGRG